MDLKYVWLALALPGLISCAQRYPLTGGDQDKTPPKILESDPPNFSTQFNQHTIELRFDEYVQVVDMTKELVVSPPLEKAPEFTVKGKRVLIKIEEDLLPDATYNINFGKGIVDFRERNPLDSNLFVFSTGDYLDSLSLVGRLVDAFTGKPVDDAVVMLYQSASDSAPYNERPYYLTRTGEYGGFRLRYLAGGTYKFFALKDRNGNYQLDAAAETYGYLPDRIDVENSDTLRIRMFKEAPEEQDLRKARPLHFGMAYLTFEKPVQDIAFEVFSEKLDTLPFFEWNLDRDSAVVWFPSLPTLDTVQMQLLLEDGFLDTATLKLSSYEDFLKKKEKGKETVTLECELNSPGGVHDYFDTLRLLANHPLEVVEGAQLLLVEGSDTLGTDSLGWVTMLPDSGYFMPSQGVDLAYKWKPATAYTLIMLPEAVRDIFGLTNDTLELSFKTRTFEDYGNLALRLQVPETPEMPLIIEQLDERNNVVKRQLANHGQTLEYDLMRPAKYRFRMIFDENGNGHWDPGSYALKTQAESVYYFPETIQIRANWDIDYDWIIQGSEVDVK